MSVHLILFLHFSELILKHVCRQNYHIVYLTSTKKNSAILFLQFKRPIWYILFRPSKVILL